MINYNYDICIVGLGPAGIGAALTFSSYNSAFNVLCLDTGASIDIKSCSILQNGNCTQDKPCQMISGFGGSSLLGGGKISAFPAGSKFADILGSKILAERKIAEALELFNNYVPLYKPRKTIEDINKAKDLFNKLGFEYKYYDVYLYNQEELRKAYERIFSQLESAGISLFLNTKLVKMDYQDNGFKLIAKHNGRNISIYSKYIILGVGRLGRTMLNSFNTKLNLNGEENYLDVGVRLEFPTDLFPDITKYHDDLKLHFDDARTFCVCMDGKIALYLLEDVVYTDGCFNPKYKSGLTNLGIMIRLKPSKQNEIIIREIKRKLLNVTKGKPICQKLSNYLNVHSTNQDTSKYLKSSISFYIQGDVNQCFPTDISTKIKEAVLYFTSRLLPKDSWGTVNVFAPEIDYGGMSFPIKSDFSIAPRMYLIGDCTGRFRGTLQAFCSGIVCAESIIGDAYEKK